MWQIGSDVSCLCVLEALLVRGIHIFGWPKNVLGAECVFCSP